MTDPASTLTTMERILFLRRVPLFEDLPPDELKQVASIAQERLFEDGELLVKQGTTGEEMFIIVSGEVTVLLETEEGVQEIARRGSGEYVGEMAIISQEPRMATLQAEGDVRALCLDQERFEQILRHRPEASLAVIRTLIARLKEDQETVQS